MSHEELFKKMVGKWTGKCRTWFEPGKLGDESTVQGEFLDLYDGSFLRHTYASTMMGKPRQGEELIAFNTITRRYQSSWVDNFHMNYAIMVSEGDATMNGFFVRGDYDVGEGEPRWGWRTEYRLNNDHLVITAYNISPAGEEAKAVETTYTRSS